MLDSQSRAFAEMGRGILEWPGVFEAAAEAGTQWYVVEQDTCSGDSLDSAAISARFMASL
jgi:sugar phosphate isomerase/epimerase